jgi:hypothetical protein
MRTRKKIARDAEVWRRYEEDYQKLMEEADVKEAVSTKKGES